MVDGRSARAEACVRAYVDHVEMRILAVVGTKQCENHCHRKGKGFLAMKISQELVDSNWSRNSSNRERAKG